MTKRLSEAQAEEVRRWVHDPFYWATRFLGEGYDPWSGQRRLWEAYGRVLNAKLKRYQCGPEALTPDETELADKMGISVMSGHGTGKEQSVSGIGLHYLSVLKCYQPKGVCTAPAGPTLQSTLWPEFAKRIASSETLSALFEKQANRIFLKEDAQRGQFMRIEPRTIQQNSNPDEQGVVLAGIHATGVIYLITEASGVPEPVFKPIEGGLTDPLSMIIMIFNPTKRTGFAAESHTKDRHRWVCLQWDARELKKEKLANPGRFIWFNERAQDTLIAKYGEDSDTVRIRVLGLPPKQSSDTLIHYDAVMEASERLIDLRPSDPLCLGVDVGGGGSGGDPSIVTVLRGPKLMAIHEFQVGESQLPELVAEILDTELAALAEDTQYAVGVDYVGLGRPVYDALRERHRLRNVYKVDVSELPIRRAEFHRTRDEVWWELREAFMDDREIVLDPSVKNYDALVAQLTSIKWAAVFLASASKIKVQGKGSSSGIPNVKPLLQSPNEADSLCIAWRMYRHYCSKVRGSARARTMTYRRKVVSWKTA